MAVVKVHGREVDTETGEVVGLVWRGQPAQPRIFPHVLSGISKSRPLPGESARIFLYLLGQVSHDNAIPGPSEVARELELHQPNVSRAYQQMVADGYLVKDGDSYHIHPFICYCGSEPAREAAIKKLLVGRVEIIAEAERIVRG